MGSNIDKLISSYLRGEISTDQELELNKWRNQKTANEQQFQLLSDIWKTPMGYPDIVHMEDQKKILWARLLGSNGRSKSDTGKQVNWTSRIMRYAAAAVLLIAVGMYIYTSSQIDKTIEKQIAKVWVVKENPKGVKSQIQLPDGTHVWLNAASSISYQRGFSDTARLVTLKGEAFFDVFKDKTRPFRVTSGEVVTTALGTSFNINSYHANEIKVSLVSGKVEVIRNDNDKGVLLTPGKQAYSKGSDLHVTEFSQEREVAWKKGILYFDNTSFEEMITVLEKWYDVKFELEDLNQKQKSMKAVGQFKNESLKNVLTVLSHSMNFEFSINKNIVKIKPKSEV